MTDPHFHVYVIVFDPDVFGIFSTRKAAEAELEYQIGQGGPAWDGCEIHRWRVDGTPEVAEEPS